MTKIGNIVDFNNVTSNITSFSHAYLFNVNSLKEAFSYIKNFAKKILLQNVQNDDEKELISYQIDQEEFDDLYIVNPDTLSISTAEIEKLFKYLETKSLRENGRRVYIIYGFERLSRDVSNKILKFLEEPSDNIYALLLTENVDKILSTILSRCQIINLNFTLNEEIDIDKIDKMKKFLAFLLKHNNETIAYVNDYFKDDLLDRKKINESFDILETIVSNSINKKVDLSYDSLYVLDELIKMPLLKIINILKITNHLKSLIKQNINLNLIIDRYIIEVSKELV